MGDLLTSSDAHGHQVSNTCIFCHMIAVADAGSLVKHVNLADRGRFHLNRFLFDPMNIEGY